MTSREEGQNCALAKVSTGASGDSKTQKLCIASFFQKFHRAETGMKSDARESLLLWLTRSQVPRPLRSPHSRDAARGHTHHRDWLRMALRGRPSTSMWPLRPPRHTLLTPCHGRRQLWSTCREASRASAVRRAARAARVLHFRRPRPKEDARLSQHVQLRRNPAAHAEQWRQQQQP